MHTLACCWFYSITPRSLHGVGEYYSFRMLYIQVLLLHNNQPLISLSSFPSARPPVVSPVCVCTCAQPCVQCAASNYFFISRSIFLLLYLSSSNFLSLFHEVFFLLYILSSSKKNTQCVQCAASNYFLNYTKYFSPLYLSSSNFLLLFHEVFVLTLYLSSSKKNTYFCVAIPVPCI